MQILSQTDLVVQSAHCLEPSQVPIDRSTGFFNEPQSSLHWILFALVLPMFLSLSFWAFFVSSYCGGLFLLQGSFRRYSDVLPWPGDSSWGKHSCSCVGCVLENVFPLCCKLSLNFSRKNVSLEYISRHAYFFSHYTGEINFTLMMSNLGKKVVKKVHAPIFTSIASANSGERFIVHTGTMSWLQTVSLSARHFCAEILIQILLLSVRSNLQLISYQCFVIAPWTLQVN